jgi:adenylyltransferase/sulfurtransferase
MTVHELKTELDAGRDLLLLDVREPDELEISRLPGVIPIPMGEIPARHGELDPLADIVVICRAGVRSARVIDFLSLQGFTRMRNLDGGMNAWATQIDPSLPVY